MAFPSRVSRFPGNSNGLQSGDRLNEIVDLLTSQQIGITATPSGNQATAFALNGAICIISVCATIADAVKLPLGYVGAAVQITNDGATSAQVYGTGTDTIQGAATATGVALAAGATAWYVCISVTAGVGRWLRYVSA